MLIDWSACWYSNFNDNTHNGRMLYLSNMILSIVVIKNLYFTWEIHTLIWTDMDNHSIAHTIYHKIFNIRRTLVGNKIVDHSDAVGALPVGTAPTASSFST